MAMKKIIFLQLLALLFPYVINAQSGMHQSESIKIYFRQGSDVLEESYMDNKSNLNNLAVLLEPYLLSNSASDVKGEGRVRISSSVSPEGSTNINERLIKSRANAIADWISNRFDVKVGYEVGEMGVDWKTLTQMVEESTEVPAKEAVLNILRNTPETIERDGVIVNERQRLLKALQEGVPYAWIYSNFYPEIRYAAVHAEIWYASELQITSQSPINFAAVGGDGVITFEKNIDDKVVPVVSCDAEWLQNIVPSGKDVKFKVTPNPGFEPRSTIVTMECYGQSYQIKVNQEANTPVFEITSQSPIEMAALGGDGVINFRSNSPAPIVPTAETTSEWVYDLQPQSNGTITFKCMPNPNTEPRLAVVRVSGLGNNTSVVIKQAASQPEVKECEKPFYMSLQTNMLYDAFLIPNVGVELYLGGNMSVDASWHYSWWKSDKKAWYWRSYGGDIALRYWFGKAAHNKPLTGQHIGLYGQMITYDFETGNRGYLADRWSWAAGVEYGYSLPIARRLNIDFTAGFGYHWGDFEEYLPIDGHYVWQATKKRKHIGPTKVEVSLVWLIGCKNYNDGKGGKR